MSAEDVPYQTYEEAAGVLTARISSRLGLSSHSIKNGWRVGDYTIEYNSSSMWLWVKNRRVFWATAPVSSSTVNKVLDSHCPFPDEQRTAQEAQISPTASMEVEFESCVYVEINKEPRKRFKRTKEILDAKLSCKQAVDLGFELASLVEQAANAVKAEYCIGTTFVREYTYKTNVLKIERGESEVYIYVKKERRKVYGRYFRRVRNTEKTCVEGIVAEAVKWLHQVDEEETAQEAQTSATASMSTNPNRKLTESEAIGLAWNLEKAFKGLTLAPMTTKNDIAGDYISTYKYEHNTMTVTRIANEVRVKVHNDKSRFTWLDCPFKTLKDTEVAAYEAWAKIAVSYLHKLDEQVTETRAKPPRTTPTEEMNIAQSLREKEGNLLKERKQQNKELKKLAKAFSRVMLEEMTVRTTDPDRINRGSPVGTIPFTLTTREPDLVYIHLAEVMTDTGFVLRKTESQKNKLLVTLSY